MRKSLCLNNDEIVILIRNLFLGTVFALSGLMTFTDFFQLGDIKIVSYTLLFYFSFIFYLAVISDLLGYYAIRAKIMAHNWFNRPPIIKDFLIVVIVLLFYYILSFLFPILKEEFIYTLPVMIVVAVLNKIGVIERISNWIKTRILPKLGYS